MDLAVLEVPRQVARQRFLEYKEAVTHTNKHRPIPDARLAEMDAEIMRGYREIWRGRQVISLSDTFRRAGAELKRWEGSRWQPHQNRQAITVGYASLPRLAVSRADKARVTVARTVNGSLRFRPVINQTNRYKQGSRSETILLPPETLPLCGEGEVAEISTWDPNWEAKVPIIPPALRPRWKLSNYYILWEAEWEKKNPPAPKDPALLRHIGGDLWAVMAVWDLTDLERAVLGRF